MGRVIFLNQKSEAWHKDNNVEVKNPPQLKLVVSKPAPPSRKSKHNKSNKVKRETLGQRIYNHLNNKDDGDAS